jgi:hypothetical protein
MTQRIVSPKNKIVLDTSKSKTISPLCILLKKMIKANEFEKAFYQFCKTNKHITK